MHLLKIDESGALYDSDEAVDLGQPAGEIIFLTSADTEVALLSAAIDTLVETGDAPDLRVANYLSLSHPYSVDLYIQNTVAGARLIVVRLLGGQAYWSYGVQQLAEQAKQPGGTPVIFLPGDGKPDPELDYLSGFSTETRRNLAAYLDAGGRDNAVQFLIALSDIVNGSAVAVPPKPLLRAGIYWPGRVGDVPGLDALQAFWQPGAPVAAIVFYRALMQAGDLAPVDALIDACQKAGLNPLPIFGASLKEAESGGIVANLLQAASVDVILNLTSFAVSDPSGGDDAMPGLRSAGPFGAVDAPVFQLVLSASLVDDWTQSGAGLTARDLAMNVALPELDGRILTRAIGFKRAPQRHALTHAMTTAYDAVPDRAEFAVQLAAAWSRLRKTPASEKRVALIMANYPNRDGRLANGVGLDTPASVLGTMRAMQDAGYDLASDDVVGDDVVGDEVVGLPQDSAALVAHLRAGPTNAGW